MRSSLLAGCLLVVCQTLAQDFPRKDLSLEKLADEIFPTQDLDLNYGELYENLAQLMSNPMDLNTITREQLRALLVVTETHVNSFLTFREENGPLLSVYELQSIPGWDRNAFDKIIPFVTVFDSQSKLNSSILQRIAREKNNYLLLRYERELETKKGYSPVTDSTQRYSGSPDKFYMRFRAARSNDFSIGFTFEKDPGEPFDWSPAQKQFLFDYFSWHAQIQNKGRIKNLIAGDYQCQFGQGLILGSVFGFGKNSETITTVRRSNVGFLPYTSLNENLFFRGLAASYSLSKNIFIHGFYSDVNKDGLTYSEDDNLFISSLSTSGLHRTMSEIENRKQIDETNGGAVLQFKNQNLDAGVILNYMEFSRPVMHTQFPYNQFAFKGSVNQNAGVYVNYNWANFTFFGELAQTIDHGRALTAGLLGSLNKKLEVSLLYRHFAQDFYSFYSNAFSENTSPQNEQGFYWGWKYTFNKKYSASGYMDLFRFPWLRYRGYAPSDGSEWLLRFNYTPAKTVSLFFQVREETKIRNLSGETNLYFNNNATKRNFWISCDYLALPWLGFKTRVQWNTYSLSGNVTRGFVVVQDVNFSISKWSFALRYAIFDTDDYENRLYVYERDVWLAYSFPAYDGMGLRCYALAQFKLSKKVDLWLRWSNIRYTNRDKIGSGGEAITGNTGNDVKFQVRIRF